MTIEHVSLRCSDFEASRKFYEKALAPLGYQKTQDYPGAAGFFADGHTSFWVTEGQVGTPTHIAFHAKDRKAVDAFHKAALAAGAKDNGAPGLRDYSPTYYAAFVLDPDGHNMEAVTFEERPESRRSAGRSASSKRAAGAGARKKAAPARKKSAIRGKGKGGRK